MAKSKGKFPIILGSAALLLLAGGFFVGRRDVTVDLTPEQSKLFKKQFVDAGQAANMRTLFIVVAIIAAVNQKAIGRFLASMGS